MAAKRIARLNEEAAHSAPPGSSATGMRTHMCGELREGDVGDRVRLCGWVATRREHGEHLAFVDLRDHSGVTQCVVRGSVEARSEWVLQVEGTVRRRPAGNENPELPTGEVELADCDVVVLARAEPPPFAVDDRAESDESVRLRYRYVDLRRPRMQANLRLRSRVLSALREAMLRQGFCEVETPLLWTPTPEGAREFAVPARLHRGEFYVLPQSPQIAKQLLMVGGVDRYFQMARCLRDEDLRADRQFEFTQLDVEASFVTASDVRGVVTEAVLDATEAAVGERPGDVQSISWQEAMDRYGVDKPDMRFEMELVDLGEVFAGTEARALSAQCVKGLRVPGGAELSRNRLDSLSERAKGLGAKGLASFKVSGAASGEDPVLESALEKFLSATERRGLVSATGAVRP
jgi:aspartyl-tRNA synthetase